MGLKPTSNRMFMVKSCMGADNQPQTETKPRCVKPPLTEVIWTFDTVTFKSYYDSVRYHKNDDKFHAEYKATSDKAWNKYNQSLYKLDSLYQAGKISESHLYDMEYNSLTEWYNEDNTAWNKYIRCFKQELHRSAKEIRPHKSN